MTAYGQQIDGGVKELCIHRANTEMYNQESYTTLANLSAASNFVLTYEDAHKPAISQNTDGSLEVNWDNDLTANYSWSLTQMKYGKLVIPDGFSEVLVRIQMEAIINDNVLGVFIGNFTQQTGYYIANTGISVGFDGYNSKIYIDDAFLPALASGAGSPIYSSPTLVGWTKSVRAVYEIDLYFSRRTVGCVRAYFRLNTGHLAYTMPIKSTYIGAGSPYDCIHFFLAPHYSGTKANATIYNLKMDVQ